MISWLIALLALSQVPYELLALVLIEILVSRNLMMHCMSLLKCTITKLFFASKYQLFGIKWVIFFFNFHLK